MSKLNICKQCGEKLRMKEVRMGMGLCGNCAAGIIADTIEEYFGGLEKARMN